MFVYCSAMNLTAITSRCIWCTEQRQGTLEHIIPTSLGCPEWFVLTEGVCQKCNNKNGKLDHALLKPFELMTVFQGMPRKGGKAPTVDSHSSFASGYENGGPAFFFNRGKLPVKTPMGKALGPTSKRDVIEEFKITNLGDGTAEISLRQRLEFGREAVRGLFKIAFETLAFAAGTELVLDPKFDPIRSFVIDDLGSYHALMQTTAGNGDAHIKIVGDGTGLVSVDVFDQRFICDFHPTFRNGLNLMAIARLQDKWLAKLPG
jgi:hypothetical protein